MAMPLSDIGMILPITKAVSFIQDLKAGQIKWNGVLDLSLDTKLKQITDTAKQRKWADAKAMADKELRLSLDPTLVMAAGMMHFCAGDKNGAKTLFEQALSMDDENDKAKLMLFIIDWLTGKSHLSTYRQELLALDWRSPNELLGHLTKVLEGLVDEESALEGGYTEDEKSWLYYMVGLSRAKLGDWAESEKLLKKAVLAADIDNWLLFLALAELEKVQNQRLEALQNKPGRARYQVEIESFANTMEKNHMAKSEQRTKLAPLIAKFKQKFISPEDKQRVMEQMLNNDPKNGEILQGLAFYSAMNEKWERALEYTRTFLKIKGRENAGRLSVGLLEAEVLHNRGRKEEAKANLEDYYRRTGDPWYLAISDHLLGEQTEQSLSEKAGESPENLVTWHTALGFWAEGSGDKKKAIKHYKEALGSYMDTRIEYDFAKERIERLRRLSE
jgi:tetratricopeptide (TPR) repeat protein